MQTMEGRMANEPNDAQMGGGAGKRGVRKDMIVQAAAALFAERGVKKTSIAKLMDKAQLTRELFYYYFKDKDELIADVIKLYVDDVCQLIDREIEAAQQTLDPKTDFVGQIALTIKGIRCVLNGIDEVHEGRIAAIMESGHGTDAARAITHYYVNALLQTESYKYYARKHGDLSALQLELVVTGAAGLVIAYPDLSDEEIAMAAHAAMQGGK